MLDGRESIPGIDVDTDLRWLIVGQLAEEGHADVALIQATMADGPFGHRTAARHGVPRCPADRRRQGGGVAARCRSERADARRVEGSHGRRALGRIDGGDPSGLLHRLGRRRRHDGPRSGPELLRPYVPGTWRRCRRCGRNAPSTRPKPSRNACTRAISWMTRWSRPSTWHSKSGELPGPRCGSCARVATAPCAPGGPATWTLRPGPSSPRSPSARRPPRPRSRTGCPTAGPRR